MESPQVQYQDIDAYIATFPDYIQKILQAIRAAIRQAVPEATEKISYQMPAFALKGNLVYFGAFKKHIGFFPTTSGVTAFKDELGGRATSKGTIQFPYDQPMPLDLIKRIARFRADEVIAKATAKKTGGTRSTR